VTAARRLAAILAVDVVGNLHQALRLKAPGGVENGLRDRSRRPAQHSTRIFRGDLSRLPQLVQPPPRNRVEDRNHADEKIWHGNRRDFPRLVSQPLFEDFGYVGHPVEIARADEALSRSRGRCHRQHLQCRDVAYVDQVEAEMR
jgi:hypothetical protein